MEEIKKEKMELADLYPTIELLLSMGESFCFYPSGKSMLPTLRPGRDSVLLSPVREIKKDDMLLYRRTNGVFVLHRVVRVEADGTLVFRGDNQYYDEKGITREQIIGGVYLYKRGEREIDCSSLSHRAYLRRRALSYPLRRFCFRAVNKIKRSFRK